MANDEHLRILMQGVSAWNEWRKQNAHVRPDLERADLEGATLSAGNFAGANLRQVDFRKTDMNGSDLSDADITEANLCEAQLGQANLSRAILNSSNLSGANLGAANLGAASLVAANITQAELVRAYLHRANLHRAILRDAHLVRADLGRSDLFRADLSGANLRRANLSGADLDGTDLSGADLSFAWLGHSSFIRTTIAEARFTGCWVFGISVWETIGKPLDQANLLITERTEAGITVDDLQVAQFIHLLLNNDRIRDLIDTITSKVVLILGRFTPERKAVLDELRNALRIRNYSPVVFDFNKPTSRTTAETITLLARMARFVIADITGARSVLQELTAVVPHCPNVPVQPLLLATELEPGMFDHFKKYPWFLPTREYANAEALMDEVDAVIEPAELKAEESRQQ